jgi:hypothetical protein
MDDGYVAVDTGKDTGKYTETYTETYPDTELGYYLRHKEGQPLKTWQQVRTLKR